ncbi:MAG: flagellar motor switch protein FliN [Gemmatales bacterium]|nr:flagellar motor switch protein FliN [Gemmatales bacterium]MCS7160201.1 flagellar motor switch protein FliN [Gemmatales bacterium]MDW8175401.1 flagellar motor switch protein FliN [Gemmatales bacterium]MDW8222289.1 flagellar motor switch protein FliN [Gemmatales bacterium]
MSATASPSEIVAHTADFAELNPTAAADATVPLERLHQVNVTITAELGRARLPLRDILRLGPGAVVELDRDVSQPIDLRVNGVLVARGEVVVVQDRFAVRIVELIQPSLADVS